jgi:methyl-accepting chemotaxis protein
VSRFYWSNWSLAAKLTLINTLLVIAAVAGVTWLFIRRDEQTVRAEMQEQAALLLNVLTFTSANPLYTLDVERLQKMMQELSANRMVVSSRVYDKTGRVLADAYDKTAPQHLRTDPFGQRLGQSDGPVFEWQADQLVAGQPVNIVRQRVGAVSVGLSTAPLKAKIAAARDQALGVALTTAVAGLLLAWLFSRSIAVPLQKMMQAAEAIEAGEFQPESLDGVAARTDALGQLARVFQRMAHEVYAREERLKLQIQELRIEVDEAKKAREVAEITQTDYFRELQDKARQLRSQPSQKAVQ